MAIVSEHTFEAAVLRFFKSLAQSKNLSFCKAASDIFEIVGNGYVLRIRRGTGHRSGSGDFVVTLSVAKSFWHDINDLRGEIGLRNFAEFHHEKLPQQEFVTLEDFDRAMIEAVAATEQFCLPILLGEVHSFQAVRRFVDQKINNVEKSRLQRIKDGTQFSWEK